MIDLITSSGFFKRWWITITLIFLGLILFTILYLNRTAILNALFPPKPLPATVAFGKLPKFDLTAGFNPAKNINYSLQTVTGELPSLPNMAKVFTFSETTPSFAGPEAIKQKAVALGFNKEPIETTTCCLKFKDERSVGRFLTVNILTDDLELTSDYLSNPIYLVTRPRSVEEARDRAGDFLSRSGIAVADYLPAQIETRNLRIDGGELTTANSLSSANIIQVIFHPVALDKINFINPKENDAPISILVAENEVVAAKVEKPRVMKFKFSTYPLKTVQEAFESLKSGNAAFNKSLNVADLAVTSVSLGYLEGETGLSYLAPVYVFKFASGVYAYVPAVSSVWQN